MKTLLPALLLFPNIVMAHTGNAHSHPEELTGGIILLVAAAGAYYLWKKTNNEASNGNERKRKYWI
ncbi:hypothetical protein [Vibrio algarum]|uniref:LPXTG cell wall anchor domain-containing protein n=1 Tax=Vibrio algarum TaxID=3020714 RepID=A0ABT4YMU0_9VIBR|nr:hypothetical protein [Vibrio sp. KJ40-1]MDB1122384.1 hypothetical protein [Vibrio sp. KJ40-1]